MAKEEDGGDPSPLKGLKKLIPPQAENLWTAGLSQAYFRHSFILLYYSKAAKNFFLAFIALPHFRPGILFPLIYEKTVLPPRKF